MSSTPEVYHQPYTPFETLAEEIKQYQVAADPYNRNIFLLEACTAEGAVVTEDNILIAANGTRHQLPFPEDVEKSRVDRERAEQKLRETLQLPQDIELQPFIQLVHDVDTERTIQEQVPSYRCRIRKHAWGDLNIAAFLNAVKALTNLTGEQYEVWANMFDNIPATIDPSTNIAELLRINLQADVESAEHFRASPVFNDEFKALYCAPESLYKAYGIEPK